MNKQELAERLARQSHRSRGQAADDVDNLVYQLLRELKAADGKATKKQPQPPPTKSRSAPIKPEKRQSS